MFAHRIFPVLFLCRFDDKLPASAMLPAIKKDFDLCSKSLLGCGQQLSVCVHRGDGVHRGDDVSAEAGAGDGGEVEEPPQPEAGLLPAQEQLPSVPVPPLPGAGRLPPVPVLLRPDVESEY